MFKPVHMSHRAFPLKGSPTKTHVICLGGCNKKESCLNSLKIRKGDGTENTNDGDGNQLDRNDLDLRAQKVHLLSNLAILSVNHD